MKKTSFAIFIMLLLCLPCSAVAIKGAPFESNIYLGVVSGIGAGIDMGFSVDFPIAGYKLGLEVQQLVTNVDNEQNINITKYGIMYKYPIIPELYLTLHYGYGNFYVPKALSYYDFNSRKDYNIEDDYRGTLSYWGIGLNYFAGEYIITPRMLINSVTDGGSLLEIGLNIGHSL